MVATWTIPNATQTTIMFVSHMFLREMIGVIISKFRYLGYTDPAANN